MNNDKVLECQNVHKSFKEGGLFVEVLRGVNVALGLGEQIAIVGSSGSGKSTLLHLLGGLDKPSQGEIWIAGQLIHRLSAAEQGSWRNRHLGFIYQFHHLLAEFTALENVAIPLLIRGLVPEQAQEQAAAMLKAVGLGPRLNHKPGELSGGERQRAAVARALVTQPQCVLADEPTGNLDQRTAEQVYEQMLTLNREIGTSLVLVTHAPELAKRMDKTYQLVDGVLVDES